MAVNFYNIQYKINKLEVQNNTFLMAFLKSYWMSLSYLIFGM